MNLKEMSVGELIDRIIWTNSLSKNKEDKAELIRRFSEKDERIKDAETLIRNIRQHLNTYEHCCDDCHKIDVMILEYEKL